jgi:hypothetical protein
MKITKSEWSKMLMLGMAAMVLSFGLLGCKTDEEPDDNPPPAPTTPDCVGTYKVDNSYTDHTNYTQFDIVIDATTISWENSGSHSKSYSISEKQGTHANGQYNWYYVTIDGEKAGILTQRVSNSILRFMLGELFNEVSINCTEGVDTAPVQDVTFTEISNAYYKKVN